MVRALHGGTRATDDSEAIEDAMQLLDMSREEAELMVRGEAPEPEARVVELLTVNLDPFRLFRAAGRQWRVKPMGGLLGLDMPGVEIIRQWLGIEATPELAEGLRVMEHEVLTILERPA